MKKLRACLLFALAILCLTSCNSGEVETSKDGETVPDKAEVMSAEESLERIEELCGLYIDPYSVSEEWYEKFAGLVDEGKALLDDENKPADCCRALAEKLSETYKSIDYNRGDVPRVYISTYEASPNLAKNAIVTASSVQSE